MTVFITNEPTRTDEHGNMQPLFNKAAARREASAKVLAAFEASGIAFGCRASINAVHDTAISEAKRLLASGINLSKSNYPFAFVGLMADMFMADAADALYARYYPKEPQ